jgi:hypothetical protein
MDTTEESEGDGHESVGGGEGEVGGERVGISLLETSLTPPNILL